MSGVGFDPKNRGTLKDYEGCGPVANWKLPGKSLREREDAKASAKDSPRNPNKNANRVDPSRNFEGGGVNKMVGQISDKPSKDTGRPGRKVGRDTPAK